MKKRSMRCATMCGCVLQAVCGALGAHENSPGSLYRALPPRAGNWPGNRDSSRPYPDTEKLNAPFRPCVFALLRRPLRFP
jgi:hypothetical protein